uniref:RH1 domain-containing protein n=1 Tax=Strigamia maritima TaxID=126957 RepID=T1IRW9_STRMM
MDDPKSQLTPEDVFDIAVEIGKEFEKLINLYSHENVTPLMGKVLNTLELLEEFTCRSDHDNTLMCELRQTISRLETEKIGKAAERERFEKELQQIEDSWKEETRDLLDLVTRLREENRKLKNSLDEKEDIKSHVCPHDHDTKLLHRMKDAVEQQRDKLKAKDKELIEASHENESVRLRAQLDKSTITNKDLRRRHKATQNQTHFLIEEKAEMQCLLQEQQQDIRNLKQTLGVNSDVDLTNKVVYDLQDPNRPRFTMDELKDILFERNDLKSKLSEIQDEIESLRPRTQQDDANSSQDDEDPPVQGPINKEPDDAPWRRHESGIRKLFRVLLGDNDSPENLLRKSISRTRSVAVNILH